MSAIIPYEDTRQPSYAGRRAAQLSRRGVRLCFATLLALSTATRSRIRVKIYIVLMILAVIIGTIFDASHEDSGLAADHLAPFAESLRALRAVEAESHGTITSQPQIEKGPDRCRPLIGCGGRI
jgi:hypothetical protein